MRRRGWRGRHAHTRQRRHQVCRLGSQRAQRALPGRHGLLHQRARAAALPALAGGHGAVHPHAAGDAAAAAKQRGRGLGGQRVQLHTVGGGGVGVWYELAAAGTAPGAAGGRTRPTAAVGGGWLARAPWRLPPCLTRQPSPALTVRPSSRRATRRQRADSSERARPARRPSCARRRPPPPPPLRAGCWWAAASRRCKPWAASRSRQEPLPRMAHRLGPPAARG